MKCVSLTTLKWLERECVWVKPGCVGWGGNYVAVPAIVARFHSKNPFFAVIPTRYRNPSSIKRSKASLINDDNVWVFNDFLWVVDTDTKYTMNQQYPSKRCSCENYNTGLQDRTPDSRGRYGLRLFGCSGIPAAPCRHKTAKKIR